MAESKFNSFSQGSNGEIKKKRIGDPNQVNQASQGAQQSVTDSSGTGVNPQFSDTGIVGIPKISNPITGILSSISNAVDTGERGGQRPPITSNTSKNFSLAERLGNPSSDVPVSAITSVPTTSIAQSTTDGASLQRQALGEGSTETGRISPISTEDQVSAFKAPPFNGKDVTFENGAGGSARVQSEKGFTQDQVESLNKELAFNSLQSTKDRFARDAQNTADSLAKYGNPYADGGSNLQSFYEKRLKEEFSRPFLRRGVINDLQGAIAGLNKDKTDRDQLAAGLVGSQSKAQQDSAQQSFQNQVEETKLNQTATKNLFELKDSGASPIELFNRYKSDIGGKPVGLGALRNIIPADELGPALQDPGAFKKLLETYNIPREDAASLSAEQRQILGQ
jgi:hypothetical protein